MRRAKGEGSVLLRKGCKLWYCQYYDNAGKQIRVSSGTSNKQEALGVLRRLMGDCDKGLAPITNLRKLHYGDLRRALLDNYLERGNRTLVMQSDGTETIPGLKALDDFFGYSADSLGVPVSQITTDAARRYVRQRQQDGTSNARINRTLALLRRMMNLAREENKIQVVPKFHLLKEPPARKGFLELKKFEELIAGLPTHLRLLITFLYYCGVRLGEALQITWEQVDLDRRLIRLEEDQTKNAEPRLVPLPSVLLGMLQEQKPKTGEVFDATNLRTEWARACTACGLGKMTEMESEAGWKWEKYTGLIVHDLRRSAVRNLVNAGVPERVAMRISGHKTRAVFDRYHIVSAEDVTAAMMRVETASLPPRKPVHGTLVSAKLVQKRPRSTRKLLTGP